MDGSAEAGLVVAPLPPHAATSIVAARAMAPTRRVDVVINSCSSLSLLRVQDRVTA
jgi:hypothetical protein